MRHNKKQKSNPKGDNAPRQVVKVTFSHPAARDVAIAGTFNNWRPEATPMIPTGNGHWLKELALPPGNYEYLFVADGKWLADPLAKNTVPNSFGGVNSLMKIPNSNNGGT